MTAQEEAEAAAIALAAAMAVPHWTMASLETAVLEAWAAASLEAEDWAAA
jgi:hypothetical protein